MKYISNKLGPIPSHQFENEPSNGPSEFVPAYVPEEPKKGSTEQDKYKPGDTVSGY